MISKVKKNTTNDNDTESDSDFDIIAKCSEKNKLFEDLDKISHLQNFIYNNNMEYQKIKDNTLKGNFLSKNLKGKKHTRSKNIQSDDSDLKKIMKIESVHACRFVRLWGIRCACAGTHS